MNMEDVGFLANFDPNDSHAQSLIQDFKNATEGDPVRVQIGYVLKSTPVTMFREPVLMTCTEGAACLVALAKLLKRGHDVVSISAETANDSARVVTASISDVLYVNVLVAPVEPERTDEDERRSKFRDAV